MRRLINEGDGLVDPKKTNLPKLIISTDVKTNFNLLNDINDAATNSNQTVTILNSNGTKVTLSFSLNQQENIVTFTNKLKEKGYVSGTTGEKTYLWDKTYTVSNTNTKQSPNFSGSSTTSSTNSKGDQTSKDADELIKTIMRPMVSNESIMEDIRRIKTLLNL